MGDDVRCDSSLSLKNIVIGAQMLFVAFGALVLVPLLTGLDPNVALFTSGVGTLLFQLITKRKVPIYLASSFAFIAPIMYGVKTWGIPSTLCGLAVSGLLYLVFAAIIKLKGNDILLQVLPPVVTGPVIMVIGLALAPTAVNMALGKTGDGGQILFPENTATVIAMVSLLITVLITILGKGMIRCIPILLGICAGYGVSLFLGAVDFSPVIKAPWFALPSFVFPQWSWQAVLFIVPAAIAPVVEHVGDIVAIGQITGNNFLKDPGVHRTMAGDGIATTVASLLGGPPNTTYSEVSGAVALTRAFNPVIMTWAAISAILLSCIGKLGALLRTIPTPVMGGIMVLLFGAIAAVGMNNLASLGRDLTKPRNMVIIAIILVFGIGGMSFTIGSLVFKGIGLAGIAGVLLNLLLPRPSDEDSQKTGPSELSGDGAE